MPFKSSGKDATELHHKFIYSSQPFKLEPQRISFPSSQLTDLRFALHYGITTQTRTMAQMFELSQLNYDSGILCDDPTAATYPARLGPEVTPIEPTVKLCDKKHCGPQPTLTDHSGQAFPEELKQKFV